MKKQLSTPVLAVLAVAAWLAASSLATWANFAYDDALGINVVYLWIWGAAMLLIPLVAVEYIERERPDRTPRWQGVLLLLLCTASAYLLLEYGGWYMWYQPDLLAVSNSALPPTNTAASCKQSGTKHLHSVDGILCTVPHSTAAVSACHASSLGRTDHTDWRSRGRQIYRTHHGRPNRKPTRPLLFRK